MAIKHADVIGTMLASPAFPPSFDNDPWLFAWSLFSRLLVMTLSAATIVRLTSRNRVENIGPSNPVFYHRMVVMCFLLTALLASTADVMTFLLWNEVTTSAMALVLIFTRVLDGLTMFPFLGALFVPWWMTWVRWSGLMGCQKGITLSGTINDLKVTWTNGVIPFRLVLICAAASAVASMSKYAAWASHVRP